MVEIIVAIITVIPAILTLIVTTKTNKRVKKQDELKKDYTSQLDEIREDIKELSIKNDENRRKELRHELVNDYTYLINTDDHVSKEKLQDIADNFEEYKALGGNHYVQDLHDIWKEKQILKKGE
jgi:ABC-type bacteriocin/lantibiotic exporter with double-glycine peptidase domain